MVYWQVFLYIDIYMITLVLITNVLISNDVLRPQISELQPILGMEYSMIPLRHEASRLIKASSSPSSNYPCTKQ